MKGAGLPDTRETCWKFFIDRVRKQLKVVLCFSPVGSTLRVRSRKFPALINCTSINWFHEWPQEALVSVSMRFLEELDNLPVSNLIITPAHERALLNMDLTIATTNGLRDIIITFDNLVGDRSTCCYLKTKDAAGHPIDITFSSPCITLTDANRKAFYTRNQTCLNNFPS